LIPVPILLYHSIADTAAPHYQPWCVHPDTFDDHLEVVAELDFTPMTVSEFTDARATGVLPPRPCLITFDDGRADFAQFAVPVLRRHSMSATMYSFLCFRSS
jgi:peptidoglycan/xylan/chitin deacetylase (PgdA/CDA1 family)